ncbi:MAG: Eco57I restriction-modification methylase domain-containing protein [Hyphomonadaceae bacterium]
MLAEAGHEERGAVFTRREVVDFILDLVGYTADRPLHEARLLEPSFGDGDFLLPVIERLLQSHRAHAQAGSLTADLRNAIRGVELHTHTFLATRLRVIALLRDNGLTVRDAGVLADAWLTPGDFLLADLPHDFTHVIGNPPYIRQEMIPQVLIDEYRRRFSTIFDRADIYVPFIERGLAALAPKGSLAFICADRWMKNRYGGPLRRFVADGFHLRAYVDMVDTPAFHSDVIAYPAIFVIGRERHGPTRLAHRPSLGAAHLAALAKAMTASEVDRADVIEFEVVGKGDEPWVLDDFEALALVRRLEAEHPTLEEAGCKVGIGVATGADQAFIGDLDALDVEPERKLPLVMTRDIASGSIAWRGKGVINPFLDDGKLAPFKQFPKFGRHLEARREEIAGRHCAQKTPANWYRTIDRIYPALVARPKLLIPDIKGEAHIVYDEGRYYPHHNLYYITSDEWDLRALQAVLLSGIGSLFVGAYSTRMRGGYLRFQAQYLRRIRVPAWKNIKPALRKKLIAAAEVLDAAACNEAVAAVYNLTDAERAVLNPKKAAV